MPKVNPLWWREIFDDLYLITDARSVEDEETTAREVDLMLELARPKQEGVILDLCGGQGRHAMDLRRRGFSRITVLDYSEPLLTLGRERSGQDSGLCFLRGDARNLCLSDGSQDCVLILGNSFGYFMDDAENARILREVRRVLAPNGRFFMDLTRRSHVERTLRPASWHIADHETYVLRERKLTGRGVISREIVLHAEKGLLRDHTYCMRLYSGKEIGEMMKDCGFCRVEVVNDHLNLGRGLMSGRMAVVAERT